MTVYFGLLLSIVNAGDLAASKLVRPISIAAIQPVSLKLQTEKSEVSGKPETTPTTKNEQQTSDKKANVKPADKPKSSNDKPKSTTKKTDAKSTTAEQKKSKDAQVKNGKKTEKDAKPKELKPLKRRVLVFKAEWCGACQQLSGAFPSLRKVRWRIGTKKTDHFQLIDVDRHPNLMNQYGVTSLPTVILLDGDKEIQRRGVLSAIDLAELYYGRLR